MGHKVGPSPIKFACVHSNRLLRAHPTTRARHQAGLNGKQRKWGIWCLLSPSNDRLDIKSAHVAPNGPVRAERIKFCAAKKVSDATGESCRQSIWFPCHRGIGLRAPHSTHSNSEL